jgi:hypothetical protein
VGAGLPWPVVRGADAVVFTASITVLLTPIKGDTQHDVVGLRKANTCIKWGAEPRAPLEPLRPLPLGPGGSRSAVGYCGLLS